MQSKIKEEKKRWKWVPESLLRSLSDDDSLSLEDSELLLLLLSLLSSSEPDESDSEDEDESEDSTSCFCVMIIFGAFFRCSRSSSLVKTHLARCNLIGWCKGKALLLSAVCPKCELVCLFLLHKTDPSTTEPVAISKAPPSVFCSVKPHPTICFFLRWRNMVPGCGLDYMTPAADLSCRHGVRCGLQTWTENSPPFPQSNTPTCPRVFEKDLGR